MKNLFSAALLCLLCTPTFAQWQKIQVPFVPLVLSAIDSSAVWSFNQNTPRIARVTNNGATWSQYDLPNADGFLLSAFISGIDTSRAWASFYLYNPGVNYVYRTLNGGQTWQQRNPAGLGNGQIISFQKFYTIDTGFLLSHNSGHVFVYRTTNGGLNWTTKTLTTNGSHLGTATYGNRHIWFYTGSGEIWRSSDDGENWTVSQTSLLADSYGLAMDFADSLHGLAFKNHYFNQLYRTADGGASWQAVTNGGNQPLASTYIWGLTKVPGLPQAWMIGYNDGTAYTLDDGNNWFYEANYPDYDFGQPAFLNRRQGWGNAISYPGIYKWQDELDADLHTCVEFTGPLTGKLRRSDCNRIWFQGSIPVDITNDPGLHLRAQLFYPGNPPSTQSLHYENIATGCPDCLFQFVPAAGKATVGELHFELPVWYASDTSQTILCTVSPTQCRDDTSNTYAFHTGYFANWFHRECFQIDTSNCAIELKTNVCGSDTNHYLIYYQVDGQLPVIGTHYEKNPSYREKIRFLIYAFGDFQSSTCVEIIDTLYTCGTSATSNPPVPVTAAVHIVPNPVSADFRVVCDHLLGSREQVIRIRDAAGAPVYTQALPPGSSTLFIEDPHLPGGFYVAERWSDNRLVAFNRFVVVKND